MPEPEIHSLSPEQFLERVRSFEFWFGAVQGYLEGREYGRDPELPEERISDPQREGLVNVLCNYCVGETAALEGAGGLIQLAPNRPTKVFLATQTADEGRHLEVFSHRLQELGVNNVEAEVKRRSLPELLQFKARLLELIDRGEWAPALFAQNVILEAMEFAVFQRHAHNADLATGDILQGVIKDERRHIGFGENVLGQQLARDPSLRPRLRELRKELDSLVLASFEHTMKILGAPASDSQELGQNYLRAVERLGFA